MNLFKITGISLVTLFAIIILGCNCCKQGTCNKPNEDGTYNVVLSFVSQASGPDRKSHMAFKEYIEQIKDKDKKLSMETYTWGREGEKDYCINFKCIGKMEKSKIVSDLNAIANLSEITYMWENTSCKHKK